MILFLDDNDMRIQVFKTRFPNAIIVRTAQEAIEELERNNDPDLIWTAVWLDHDLGGDSLMNSADPNSGYEVVRWIVRNQPSIVDVYVHSWNPVAAPEMVVDLTGAGYVVHRVPFDTAMFASGEAE